MYSRIRLLLCLILTAGLLAPGSPVEAQESLLPFSWNSGPELSWVPGDDHHHSTYSDGRADVREILMRAKENGIGWMMFTDHTNHLNADTYQKQIAEVKEISAEIGVLGLVGQEIGSRNSEGSKGHLLLFNYHQHILEDNELDEIMLLKAVSGLQLGDPVIGVIAHPNCPFYGWRTWPRTLPGGIELLNGITDRNHQASNKVLKRWDWYVGHGMTAAYFGRSPAVGMGGSDSHNEAIGGDLPVTYLALPKKFTERDVLNAVSAGRAIVSSRQGILADFTVNGVHPGGVLGLRARDQVQFTVRLVYGDGSYETGLEEIRIYRGQADGNSSLLIRRKFKDAPSNRPEQMELVLPLKENLFTPCYYRLEAVFVNRDPDNGKINREYVYTNPVFVKPLQVPILTAYTDLPVEITGTTPTQCLSYSLDVDQQCMSTLLVRVNIQSSRRVATGVSVVFFDQNGDPYLASEIMGREGKTRRTVDYRMDLSGLPAGRYRIAVMACNEGEGKGRVLSQAVLIEWIK